ncbi:MAG: hypothetical protein HY360_17150 [Verrucomicrobia bacterium]|nr:hypothetical protein [Verrucomicrobiota bacterium]
MKLTLDVPMELSAVMDRYPAIPWDRVAADALWNYARKMQLADQIALRSRLSETAAADVGREVKAGLRRHYAKAVR